MMMRNTVSNALVMATLAVGSAWAQDSGTENNAAGSEPQTFERGARDAWIHGKLEAVFTLNRHLNPFSIDTSVENGMVTLEGTVESDIDRDLAGELAKGIEGVSEVDNRLEVDSGKAKPERTASADTNERPFAQWVDDATTTAAVKTKLTANTNVKAVSIDVDTWYDVVTLRGEVESSEEKALAEQLAQNTNDVERVVNELTVKSDS